MLLTNNRLKNKTSIISVTVFITSLFLASCGGGDTETTTPAPPPPPPPPPAPKTVLSEAQASAFLNRATFGATREAIDELVSSNVEDWFQQQVNLTPSLLLPYIEALPDQQNIFPAHRVRGWWLNAVHGDDQLRQRVAFALSEIFVASDRNDFLSNHEHGMADFNDLLVNNAFGNYRELLEKVTLHPVMGVYLSMLGNRKANPAQNIRPDENYAREVMQLFSIGLVELNQDGTLKLDNQNNEIATYDQNLIESFAQVFTGWTFAGSTRFSRPNINMLEPMEPWEEFHDIEQKTLLNGLVIPAGQTAAVDLAMALDNLADHQNVAPFISHKIIQRLVTSNPSAAYIERIATVFNDNGQGERGDLEAVVLAILLDDEALNGRQNFPNTFGKLREPLIRNAHLWRAFNALSNSNQLPFGRPDFLYGQAPQRAHHVFNFFYPDYSPPGAISDAGMVAPEFEIATANNLTGMHNVLIYFSIGSNNGTTTPDPDDIILDLDALIAIADDHDALIDELDMIFTAGQLTDAMKVELSNYLDLFDQPNLQWQKVTEITFLIMTSNEYAIQK